MAVTYDFENGQLPSGWTVPAGATTGWAVTAVNPYQGSYSLKAGTVADKQYAAIRVTHLCKAGTVSFYIKTISEIYYDYLYFYIDGIWQYRWSGNNQWVQHSQAVSAGLHTFEWRYVKDEFVSVGDDTAWIDQVSIPAIDVQTVPAFTFAPTLLTPFILPIVLPAFTFAPSFPAPQTRPVLLPAFAFAPEFATPEAVLQFPVSAFTFAPAILIPGWANNLIAPAFMFAPTFPVPVLMLTPFDPRQAVPVYRCILTGGPDSLPDVELPIGSLNARRTAETGQASYLSITVPNPTGYAAAITARPNGLLTLLGGFRIGRTESLTRMFAVPVRNVRYDYGPGSGSLTIDGTAAMGTVETAKAVTLDGINYYAYQNGLRRHRVRPDWNLAPGDTVTIGDESYPVGTITYTVSPRQATMEVSEATT